MSVLIGSNQQINNRFTVGVDVGGTTITVLVVDSNLHEVAQVTQATDVSTPDTTIHCIARAIFYALETAHLAVDQVTAVGLGIPGRVDPATGDVRLAVNLNWDNIPARELLSQALGVPCYLENDVRLAALGSYQFMTNAAVQNMAYVSIGTGIAAGLILEGNLYRGSSGMAGEIGHIIMDPKGPRCNCGNVGCLEAFAAGPAIVRAAEEAVSRQELNLSDKSNVMTAESVFAAAKAGNQSALRIVDQVGSYLGRGLQMLLMAYDVDLILLGGGISRAGKILVQSIIREWQRQAKLSPLAADMVSPDKLQLSPPNQNAGVWGGIALALHKTAVTGLNTAVKT